MKKFLVTGGSGFVGSYVVKNFFEISNNDFIVDILDNQTSFSEISNEEKLKNKKYRENLRSGARQYFEFDTNNYRLMIDIISSQKYDVIIHLAAML